jgi:actin-related protein
MAQEVILNVRANTKEAEASLKGVNSEIKNTQQVSGELSGSLDKMTGGAITKFNAFKGTLKGVTGGFKSLRVAIISTGIGALILAVGSLTAAFTASEEGQNKFRKILGIIGSVTGNLVDLLADLGEGIINVFENPKQAIEDFKNLIVENITNRFNSLLETVGYVGKAIKLVFQGEFSQALDVGKKAASSLVDSFTGIPNTIDKATESVKGFAKEIQDDANAAAKIADQRAEIDKRSRQLLVDRAKAERDIAALREKAADKENFTAAERIKFLEEAGQISEGLANKEIAIAQLRFEAKQVENSLSKSTKEDLEEQAQLEADVIAKQTARLRLQKALTAELTTARREDAAEADRLAKEEQAKLDEAAKKETDRLAAIEKIQDEFKLKQDEKDAQTNLQKAELEEQRKLAELDALNATEEQKQAVRDYYAGVKLDAEKADTEASIELSNKEAEAKRQNLAAVGGALSNFATLVGEQTGAGKAAAIAATLISTYQSAQDSYKSLAGIPIVGPALGAAAAAVAVASGLKQIQAIKSVKVPKSRGAEGGGGATPSASGFTAAAQAPQFNVIGGGAQNQLAGLLADQSQKPVKAYVVSNEVSTAQSLDRNIVESATLG